MITHFDRGLVVVEPLSSAVCVFFCFSRCIHYAVCACFCPIVCITAEYCVMGAATSCDHNMHCYSAWLCWNLFNKHLLRYPPWKQAGLISCSIAVGDILKRLTGNYSRYLWNKGLFFWQRLVFITSNVKVRQKCRVSWSMFRFERFSR